MIFFFFEEIKEAVQLSFLKPIMKIRAIIFCLVSISFYVSLVERNENLTPLLTADYKSLKFFCFIDYF